MHEEPGAPFGAGRRVPARFAPASAGLRRCGGCRWRNHRRWTACCATGASPRRGRSGSISTLTIHFTNTLNNLYNTYTVQNLHSSIYRALGIDPAMTFENGTYTTIIQAPQDGQVNAEAQINGAPSGIPRSETGSTVFESAR